MMVLGGGAFEVMVGGITAFIKEIPENSLAPSALILVFPASRKLRNVLLISCQVYHIFVIAVQLTRRTSGEIPWLASIDCNLVNGSPRICCDTTKEKCIGGRVGRKAPIHRRLPAKE